MKAKVSPALNKPCQFGDWQFDPTDGQLCSKTNSVRLQPRLSKLLSVFVANVNTLISRNELIEILWQEKSVNEDALSRCIAELRSTLGDNRNSPIYIETVPKKGYRFIHPLSANQGKKLTYSLSLAVLILVASSILYLSYPFTANIQSSKYKDALTNAKRLTADKKLEHQPVLSTSGNSVAFSLVDDKRLIVRIIDIDGKHLHELKDPHYHLSSAAFSPDDKSLLVAARDQTKCTIFKYQLPSLVREDVGQCFVPNLSNIFDWSPNGEQIAYVAQGKNTKNAAIWTYHFASKKPIQITQPSTLGVFDTNPQYSPDGKYLGFTRGTESTRNIHIVNIEIPEKVIAVTRGKGFITHFNWLNDNKHLLFDSNQLGDRNLWLVNINNHEQQLLGGRDAQFPTLNKDNTRLAFQEIRYNANIWRVDVNDKSSKPTRIIESIKYNNFPAFSPSGKQIAFSSNRQGKSAVWLYSLETKKQTKLISLPELDMIMPQWSHDGKKLIVSSKGADGYRCYQIDPTTQQYQIISTILQPHFGCVYSKYGDIFAITKDQSKLSKVLKLEPNGIVKKLTENSVSRIQVSNFDSLVYSLPKQNGLYSMDFNGKNRQTILTDFSYQFDEHWTVQGDYLYYPKLDKEKGIWQRHLITGEEQKVTSELPSAIGLTISVNPEHSQLIFTKTDNRQADIYLATMK
ncbi:winged helix-turn-helix domain-containing protein [Aliikangiella sp. IMCC44359]|uniref:winged helix-turn-helix domain-containing protein n=1 Tax=Aliikangiella sp. IMCC44359 TaxID=3459125 RepID=UPI00403AD1AE